MEDIRVIRVDRSRALLVGLGALALLGASLFLTGRPDPVECKVGWLGVVFSGVALGFLAVQLLPGAASLTLDREGFVVRALFRDRKKVRWRDVACFALFRYNRAGFVGYNFVFEYTGKTSAISAAMGGPQGSLGNLYELKPAELAVVMEEWRVRHSAALGKIS